MYCLETDDHKKLIRCTIDPTSYTDRGTFFNDYAAISLLSKYDNLDLGVDRAAVALESFLKSEETCRLTNIRLSAFNRTLFTFKDRLPSYIDMARGKIERLLGRFDWDQALHYMHFSSGASTDVPRRKGNSWYKYGLRGPSTTGNNAVLANCLIRQFPQWETIALDFSKSSLGLEIVRGDRITTVPKSAKTDRVIAIQPTMNLIVQKGIGGLLRSRLKRVGIDLNSQERNQLLARAGSVDGSLATIDLKAASDTIAYGLVELLLPEDWFRAMQICRCDQALWTDGSWIRYQKFSSMGNGFTFELESMIFWALAESVTQLLGGSARDVSVYGDDIIVPSEAASEVTRCLSYVGFETNTEKTFSRGPFRESCGKHYFRGSDVTPIYIRKDVDTLERKLWLANSIRGLAHRKMGIDYGCCGELLPAWESVRRSLPKKYQRPSIPVGYGDGGLVGTFDEVCPRPAKNVSQFRGWEGYAFKHRIRVFDKKHVGGDAALIKTLREGCRSYHFLDFLRSLRSVHGESRLVNRVEPGGVELCEIPLQSFSYRVITSVARQWEDYGPWVGEESLNHKQ